MKINEFRNAAYWQKQRERKAGTCKNVAAIGIVAGITLVYWAAAIIESI